MAGVDLAGSWFEPRRLFGEAGRYPGAVSSALRVLPGLLEEVRRTVAALAPRRALEIGPGDAEAIAAAASRVYVDLVPGFLRGKRGACVLGDVRALPLRADAFDLAVANDVFTHVPPADRPAAIRELARVARRIVIFNPEPGTREVAGSAVPTEALEQELARAGYATTKRRFVARPASGEYAMVLLTAERVTS
jgi:ubiquinone/menaquinone biosynthesis C-methylase UbiE